MTDTGGFAHDGQRTRAVRAFDIRMVIAALFAFYGVVLTVMGVAATSGTDIEKAAGVNINLWAGIAMLLFAGAMAAWTLARPAVVTSDDGAGPEDHGAGSAG